MTTQRFSRPVGRRDCICVPESGWGPNMLPSWYANHWGKLDLIIPLDLKQEEQSSEIPPLPVQLCLTERAWHVVQRLHVKVLC